MAAHTFQAPQLPVLPDMPTAFGAVLQRVSAAMMAPSGLFGRGSGWREGATLATCIAFHHHFSCVSCGLVRLQLNKPLTSTPAISFPNLRRGTYRIY